MTSRRNPVLLSLAAGISIVCTTIAGAAGPTYPKEGSYDVTSCWSGVNNPIAFAKTFTASSYEIIGSMRSNPPGGIYDRNSFHCVGLNTTLDGKRAVSSVCEYLDADGDKRLTQFTLSAEGKMQRQLLAGTGKYEGMVETAKVASGGVAPVIKAGTFQECQQVTGTYKLK